MISFILMIFLICVLNCLGDTEEERRLLLSDPVVLGQRVTELESKLQLLNDQMKQMTTTQSAKIQQLEKVIETQRSAKHGGALFTRWGKHDCPVNTSEKVYTGFAAGGWYDNTGSATNYLCLPEDPILSGKTVTAYNYIWGAEYESNFWQSDSPNQDVPCAVCKGTGATLTLMIPGRSECYTGWTKQYQGHLGTEYYDHKSPKEYVCIDNNPEYVNGGAKDENGALFYPVLYSCGALKCPPYKHGQVAGCVVCTQ